MKTDLEQFSHELEPAPGPGAASYVTGALGALLGGMVGAIPLVLVGAFTGLFSGWLGFLIGFAAVKGYTLFKGARKHGYAVAVVVCASCLVVLASCALCALIYFSADPDVLRAAERWGRPVFEVAWSVLTENVGLVLVSFALPILVSGAGIFIARRKLVDYTRPEQLQKAAQAAEAVLAKDSETSLYFPDVAYRKNVGRSNLLLMLPFLLLFALLLVLLVTPATSERIESSMAFMGLSIIFLFLFLLFAFVILFRTVVPTAQAMEFCYARDGQGTVWQVRILRLNAIAAYQYGSFSGLTQINFQKLSPAQCSMVQASVLRAIQDVREGHAYPGSGLTNLVIPLEQLEIRKENRWGWRCTYLDANGKRKRTVIGKACPGFHPLDDREAGAVPSVSFKPMLAGFALALVVVLLFLAALYFLAPETAPEDLSAHTYAPLPLGGVTVAVDESWEELDDGVFRSADGAQVYRLTAFPLGDHEPQEALDEVLAYFEGDYTTFNSEALYTTPHARDGITAGGDPYQYGTIGAYESEARENQTFVAVIFAPDRDLWITLQGSGDEGDAPVIAAQVKKLLESLVFQAGGPSKTPAPPDASSEGGYIENSMEPARGVSPLSVSAKSGTTGKGDHA